MAKPKPPKPAPPKWPAAKVEMWPLARLKPYERNARTHSPEQVAQIAASMREWGFTNPVLAQPDGTIIAGHGRVLAAQANGYPEAPVMVAQGWTDAQIRAFVIADNQLALNAGWDDGLLKLELEAIQLGGFDISLTGFSADELKGLSLGGGAAGMTPDEARKSLAERFGVVPFSVLNAREGWWQNRKAAWLALGIESEVGRGENLIGRSLHGRLTQIISGHYSEIVAFIDEHRAKGMTDDEIEAAAFKSSGRKQSIPGGAGKNSVYKSRGNLGISGSQGLADGGNRRKPNAEPGGSKRPAADYGKSHARGDGTGKAIMKNGKRAAAASGQDLMKGEGKFGPA